MYSFAKYKAQYKINLLLALPVVATQLGQVLVQVADNVMVGNYGGNDPTPLAAVSFGGAVFFILFITGIGITLGLTPLIGELYAQGDKKISAGYLQNGILFYTLLGLLVAALQFAVIPLMHHLGQPAEVVDMAIPYYKMLAFSMPFIMLFFAFKQFLEGVGNTKVEMFVVIFCNLANVCFNWMFIYGNLGMVEMGAEGAGLGTLLSRIMMPILIIGYFYNRDKYRSYLDGFSPLNYSWATVRTLLRMGLPISMQMFLEASAFVGTGIMMGWFDTMTISAYQITTTLGNCAFMIVMSIGAATTIVVSHNYGARRMGDVALAAKASYHLVLAWNTLAAIAFISLRNYIPMLFTTNPEVIEVASN
ncbi:MAG: MATE family efflux transporter, partial [Alistipes sp.]